jgi:hypothetical protein
MLLKVIIIIIIIIIIITPLYARGCLGSTGGIAPLFLNLGTRRG